MRSYRHLRFSGEIQDIWGRVYALARPRVPKSEFDEIPLLVLVAELDDGNVRPADAIRIRRGLRDLERAESPESPTEPRRRSRGAPAPSSRGAPEKRRKSARHYEGHHAAHPRRRSSPRPSVDRVWRSLVGPTSWNTPAARSYETATTGNPRPIDVVPRPPRPNLPALPAPPDEPYFVQTRFLDMGDVDASDGGADPEVVEGGVEPKFDVPPPAVPDDVDVDAGEAVESDGAEDELDD